MEHGIVNSNEFYTANYWDEILSKDLKAKTTLLVHAAQRAKDLKDLERTYWLLKETLNRDEETRVETLANFYRNVLRALNFEPAWERQQSLMDGAVFSTFATAGKGETRAAVFMVTEPETGEFEGVPQCLAELSADETTDTRLMGEILDEEFSPEIGLEWAIVCTPEAMFLAERSKWPLARFLKAEWDHVFTQRGLDVYQEILGLFAREHLAPESGKSIHEELDDSSHKHAFAVTTALRESVRQGIEDLVDEMVAHRRKSHQKYMPDHEGETFARELTRDALFYIYRIIFLMYVEAQGDDADTLPLKSEIYRGGYSIEKLVEVSLKDISPASPEYDGTFIHESLQKIFALIWNGYGSRAERAMFEDEDSKRWTRTGFFVKGIKSDLFDPAQIKHLGDTVFRNHVLQAIIKRLSFAKGEGRRAQTGRISYANLGINQLGAVYEGLLSYTGYFAKEPLVALKPKDVSQADIDRGKVTDDIYICSKKLADSYRKNKTYQLTDEHFVRVSVDDPRFVEYPQGSFIYRLAGRDRQKLASYYTPESLTKLTVRYALKVLFENKKTAEELLNLKILEPAMGSGAFLGETVAQIAEQIVAIEARESKTALSAAERKRRYQDVKYHLITNSVYGVDLNPTAIELAKFSLWLGCIGAAKDPPDFTGRLKQGNSLIGARFDKTAAGLYPWLCLDEGMLNYGNKLRDYDPVGSEAIKGFRREFLASEQRTDPTLVQAIQKQAETLFAALPEENAYGKLKSACDLWCTLFFLTAADLTVMPATHEGMLRLQEKLLNGAPLPTPTKAVVERVLARECFFHWDIEFPRELRSGGFDLILANPPWVAVGWEDAAYVADLNPVPTTLKLNAATTRTFLGATKDDAMSRYLADEYISIEAYTQMLNVPFYRLMKGGQKNTYKAFDILMTRLMAKGGAIGVIQQDGILDDEDATDLRQAFYQRLRYHFQFQNQLFLFAEIGHRNRYSVNILQDKSSRIAFDHIGNLFAPGTVDDCYGHAGPHDPVPLIKGLDGKWDLRGHQRRIIHITDSTLKQFGKFLNQEKSQAPTFLNLHSQDLVGFVEKIGACTTTLRDLVGEGNYVGSEMLHEVGAQDDGLIKKSPGRAKSLDRVVLSGPNIATGNPLSQESRDGRSKADYDSIDLTQIPTDFIPRTVFQFTGEIKKVDEQFPRLREKPYRQYYRIGQRGMINAANERCLFTAVIPKGWMHIHGIKSVALENEPLLALAAGYGATLVFDGVFRLRNRSNFFTGDFVTMPIGHKSTFHSSVQRRALALNCLTLAYADLWSACRDLANKGDTLISKAPLGDLAKPWEHGSPLRQPADREQALIEIDALVALSFGLSADELTQIYEVLFPVLNKYDREAGFDRKAKLVEAHRFFSERGW